MDILNSISELHSIPPLNIAVWSLILFAVGLLGWLASKVLASLVRVVGILLMVLGIGGCLFWLWDPSAASEFVSIFKPLTALVS